MNFDTIYNQTLEYYEAAAKTLRENNNNINACDCSHQTAKFLIDVDNGLYGPKFMGCLNNKDILEAFAKSKTFDILQSQGK